MMNYVVYERNELGCIECIVDILNNVMVEKMLYVQQELTSKGYIILEVFGGRFIKCHKIEEGRLELL